MPRRSTVLLLAAVCFGRPPAAEPRGFGSGEGVCPPGSYAVRAADPRRPAVCVPEQAYADAAGLGACADFNVLFGRFHRGWVREYGSAAERNRSIEERILRHIKDQKALSRKLQRQAFRARQMAVRRTLGEQARGVDRDIRDSTRRLRELERAHRSKEEGWKRRYKREAQELLQARPAACAVSVTASTR
ncbi:MAG: hypothetical protein ABII00_10695 [Elusimicrobiota bacterium]